MSNSSQISRKQPQDFFCCSLGSFKMWLWPYSISKANSAWWEHHLLIRDRQNHTIEVQVRWEIMVQWFLENMISQYAMEHWKPMSMDLKWKYLCSGHFLLATFLWRLQIPYIFCSVLINIPEASHKNLYGKSMGPHISFLV